MIVAMNKAYRGTGGVETFKTKVIENNENPEWNEIGIIDVKIME